MYLFVIEVRHKSLNSWPTVRYLNYCTLWRHQQCLIPACARSAIRKNQSQSFFGTTTFCWVMTDNTETQDKSSNLIFLSEHFVFHFKRKRFFQTIQHGNLLPKFKIKLLYIIIPMWHPLFYPSWRNTKIGVPKRY